MNQISHYHDASNVYGSDEEDAGALRLYSGGLMKSYDGDTEKELLPQTDGDQESEECQISRNNQILRDRKCFTAGDSRSNEQPGEYSDWLTHANTVL